MNKQGRKLVFPAGIGIPSDFGTVQSTNIPDRLLDGVVRAVLGNDLLLFLTAPTLLPGRLRDAN